jgi:formylglycine-generating enzyme required for sulfatase activity
MKNIIATSLIGVALFAVTASLNAEPKTGELLTFKINSVELRFRYCPSGETFNGRPDAENAKSQFIKGFYIQETEMSIDEFITLTSMSKIDEVKNRLVESDKTQFDGTFPIRGIIIEDTNSCIQKLTETDTLTQDTTTNIEKRLYRLPTSTEWQYACRATQKEEDAKKNLHFGNGLWPQYDTIPEEIKRDSEDIWKEMKETENFEGSQSQVVKIIEHFGEKNKKCEKILQSFFKAGFLNKRQNFDVADSVREVSGEPENNWHIKGMLGNVKEWTQDGKDYYLYGGAFNNQIDSNLWKNFTIWGGGNAKKDFKETPLEDIAVEEVPGFRLVLTRIQTVYWLLICRQTILKDKNEEKQKDNETKLQDLLTEKEYKEMSNKIDTYKTIQKTNDKQLDDKQFLAELQEQLPKDDDYFSYFKELE